MNTKERTQEQISALADGELVDSHIEIALAALRDPEQRGDWDLYHQIGDVLRSEDMAFSLSGDFSTRLAARLDAEPAIVAPIPQRAEPQEERSHMMKRFGVPGMAAAAAVATVMFVTTPLVMRKEGAGSAVPVVALASAPVTSAASAQIQTVTAGGQETVMLRDSRIDEYLMAHQRFSPSVFGSAQYARSATFAADSGK